MEKTRFTSKEAKKVLVRSFIMHHHLTLTDTILVRISLFAIRGSAAHIHVH